MSVELWKAIFDWGTVVLAAFTFIALAGALLTGDVLNKRQAKEIEELKKQAGEAVEKAGRANERAGEIESANLTLRGQIAKIETDAANAKTEMAKQQAVPPSLKRIYWNYGSASNRVSFLPNSAPNLLNF